MHQYFSIEKLVLNVEAIIQEHETKNRESRANSGDNGSIEFGSTSTETDDENNHLDNIQSPVTLFDNKVKFLF